MNDEQAGSGSNRGAWIIGGAIMFAAVLIVGTLVALKDDPCGAWQDEIQGAADTVDERGGGSGDDPSDASPVEVAAFDGALDDLRRIDERRPAGCDYPSKDAKTWADLTDLFETED